MSDEISDAELREMLVEADEIEAQPKLEYTYRDPEYKGGPRRFDDAQREQARQELGAARIVFEEYDDARTTAQLALYEAIERQVDAGAPIELVAQHSGYNNRSKIYRVLDHDLPMLRERMQAVEVARALELDNTRAS